MDYSGYFVSPTQAYDFNAITPDEDISGSLPTSDFNQSPLQPLPMNDLRYDGIHEQPSGFSAELSLDPNSLMNLEQNGFGNVVDSFYMFEGVDRIDELANGSIQRRGSSEEPELTPAQSRRKAQNRAAQRAFRERKERHVKDLEAKLTTLENNASSLATDNKRLKLALQRATSENEMLRISTPSFSHSSRSNSSTNLVSPSASFAEGPASGSRISKPLQDPDNPRPVDFATVAEQALKLHIDFAARNSPLKTRLPSTQFADSTWDMSSGSDAGFAMADRTTNRGDGRTVPLNRTWDLIQAHPLVQQGKVDIADVCEKLQLAVKFGKSSPVFRFDDIKRAIEQSSHGPGDDLMPL